MSIDMIGLKWLFFSQFLMALFHSNTFHGSPQPLHLYGRQLSQEMMEYLLDTFQIEVY